MSVMKDVVLEEYQRLEKLLEMYNEKISHFPKGVIVKKKRGQKYYCYLSYRVNDKVKSDYIGSIHSAKAEEMMEKIAQRNKYESLRKKVKENLQDLERYVIVAKR